MSTAAIDDTPATDLEAGPRIAGTRERFDRAFQKARSHPASPWRTFDFKRDDFLRRCAGQGPRARLAVLIEGAGYFENMADPTNWPTSRHVEEQQRVGIAAASAGSQLRAMGLGFNPHQLIGSMRSRGLSIAATADGNLVISPAAMLNDVDREIMRANKVAIVAALADSAVF
jgi:hypothetical protein